MPVYYIIVDGDNVGEFLLEGFTINEYEIIRRSTMISKCLRNIKQILENIFDGVNELILAGDMLLVKVDMEIPCNKVEESLYRVLELYERNTECSSISVSIACSTKLELTPLALAIAKNTEYLGQKKHIYMSCNSKDEKQLIEEITNKILRNILNKTPSLLHSPNKLVKLGKLLQTVRVYAQFIENSK